MKLLILTQPFRPDVASVAQHASDLARELVAHGHKVTVVASRSGYDNPKIRFCNRERWKGVDIIRIRHIAADKRKIWRRAISSCTFLLSCFVRSLLLPRFDVIIAMTAPPLLGTVGALVGIIRRSQFVYWVMDLNPDEAVAAEWLRPDSRLTGILESLSRFTMRRATKLVVLDRFMEQRLLSKGLNPERLVVIPPWAHDDVVQFDEASRVAFREEHGLSGKFVVMHSGNHTAIHPLKTLLESAAELGDHPRIVFCFVGGGTQFRLLENFARANRLKNIKCLPYQPLDKLAASLSSADLQVVIMGDPFVGIIHPCKVYNILTLGTHMLYIGPETSHVVDLVPPDCIGRSVYCLRHGDVRNLTAALVRAAALDAPKRPNQLSMAAKRFSYRVLIPQFIDVLEGLPARCTTRTN